jgi:acyl carrier protein
MLQMIATVGPREAMDWIADIFEEPKSAISSTTRRTDIAGWDSLGQLILMAALDQRFSIRLSRDELSSLDSVQDILTVLGKYGVLHP